MYGVVKLYRITFQLTPSRRATRRRSCVRRLRAFQLTPSRRATSGRTRRDRRNTHFNSRPHGGRQCGGIMRPSHYKISTHALTEGDKLWDEERANEIISTHALTEGDNRKIQYRIYQSISTHALTEGDEGSETGKTKISVFQLTPSRRATKIGNCSPEERHFNSRPHGGRLQI